VHRHYSLRKYEQYMFPLNDVLARPLALSSIITLYEVKKVDNRSIGAFGIWKSGYPQYNPFNPITSFLSMAAT